VQRKKEMGRRYEEMLADVSGIELIPTDFGNTVPWFFDILAERRTELIAYLRQKNIGSREFYPPLHAQPAYGYMANFPVAEQIAGQGLWLPSSSFLSDEQIEYVCDQIRSFYSV